VPINNPEKLRDGEPVPEVLRPSIARAKTRTLARRHPPVVALDRSEPGPAKWSWPFGETEEETRDWRWLILDAFGTRREAIAGCFLNSLIALCSTEWDDSREEWIPNEGELAAMLGIVNAHQPKNEAEAALAAQMAAVHLLTMKVGKRVADYPHDTRMINAFAKLTHAGAAQFDAMVTLKGKRRSTRQHITVARETHVHHHQHVHLAGGGDQTEGQPDEPNGTGVAEGCAALPGPDEAGRVVPLKGGARKASLLDARRS